jgi:NAD(P)-dependent dehydrogenase (short-subunit alcohol dehydrogenase family)
LRRSYRRTTSLRAGAGLTLLARNPHYVANNHQEITTMASSKRFEGKTAFTGAASGIGRAAAIAFAAEGARVVVTDRGGAALRETAEHVKASGAEVLAITCDVSKPEEVQAAVAQAVKTFGRIDCAFNNAGVENKAMPLHEIELQEWDRACA